MSTTTDILKLDTKRFAQVIRDYIAARRAKSEADKASRAADNTAKQLQAALDVAMHGQPVALCGNSILTWKDSSAAQATFTLTDGTVLPWLGVTEILCGNTVYRREEIAKIYGGRDGSHVLNVEGTP